VAVTAPVASESGCAPLHAVPEDDLTPADLDQFAALVRSPLATRIARVVELGGNFPILVADPLAQFLVEEAVLVSYAHRRREAEEKVREEVAWEAVRLRGRQEIAAEAAG
jgi:hypothetical protein